MKPPPPMPIIYLRTLCMIAEGLTKQQIADRLSISHDAVRSRRANVARTLGIRTGGNNAVLVAAAFEQDYFRPTAEDPVNIPIMTSYGFQVLMDITDGMESKAIAAKHNRTLDSVKGQIALLLRLWGATNRANLVYLAHMSRLLPRHAIQNTALAPVGRITPLGTVESTIITLLADGNPRSHIADVIGMSRVRTLRVTNAAIAKLNATNGPHGIAMAYCHGYLSTSHQGTPNPPLNRRDVRILECCARGWDRTETARHLDETERAIKYRLIHIAEDLAAVNHAHLVHRGFQTGNLVLRAQGQQ